ncbi:hypothetical protein D3C85_1068840 [compost metagenome]
MRQACSLFTGLIEITAILDHLAAKAAHGLVLFDRVTFRHHDQRSQSQGARRQCQTLTVIAASGGDDAFDVWVLALEPVHERNAAAHLESTRRCVVFVLDPHRATQPLGQQGPSVLGGGRHHLVNVARGLFDIVAGQSVHERVP